MAAIVTNDVRVFNAAQFVESLSETAGANIYCFIGQPAYVPPAASPDNVKLHYEIWDNMIALKRVTSSDIKPGIRKILWQSGNVYNTYNQNDANLHTRNFYVINSDDNGIYKCVGNARSAGTSTVAPTQIAATGVGGGTASNLALLSDSYKWKYMGTITAGDLAKFGTPSFVPLTNDATVQGQALEGAIHHIEVTNAGSGYTTAPAIRIQGDGTGANAWVNLSAGTIANVIIDAVGFNYRFANVLIQGGGGSGAVLTPLISPVGGHGSNQMNELGASYAILNARIQTTDTAFPTGITYHQVGLVQDPLTFGTSTPSQASTLKAYNTAVLASAVGGPVYQGNTLVQQSSQGPNAYILGTDPSVTSNIRYIQTANVSSNITQSYAPFKGALNTGVYTIAGTVSCTYVANAEVRRNSGKILYVDTRAPITRVTNQSESISIILEF